MKKLLFGLLIFLFLPCVVFGASGSESVGILERTAQKDAIVDQAIKQLYSGAYRLGDQVIYGQDRKLIIDNLQQHVDQASKDGDINTLIIYKMAQIDIQNILWKEELDSIDLSFSGKESLLHNDNNVFTYHQKSNEVNQKPKHIVGFKNPIPYTPNYYSSKSEYYDLRNSTVIVDNNNIYAELYENSNKKPSPSIPLSFVDTGTAVLGRYGRVLDQYGLIRTNNFNTFTDRTLVYGAEYGGFFSKPNTTFSILQKNYDNLLAQRKKDYNLINLSSLGIINTSDGTILTNKKGVIYSYDSWSLEHLISHYSLSFKKPGIIDNKKATSDPVSLYSYIGLLPNHVMNRGMHNVRSLCTNNNNIVIDEKYVIFDPQVEDIEGTSYNRTIKRYSLLLENKKLKNHKSLQGMDISKLYSIDPSCNFLSDGNKIIYYGISESDNERVLSVDVKTFRSIYGYYSYEDKDYIYFGEMLKKKFKKTGNVEIITNNDGYREYYYLKTNKAVYNLDGKKVSSDPQHFTILSYNVAKDSKYVYFGTEEKKKIKGADAASFEAIPAPLLPLKMQKEDDPIYSLFGTPNLAMFVPDCMKDKNHFYKEQYGDIVTTSGDDCALNSKFTQLIKDENLTGLLLEME